MVNETEYSRLALRISSRRRLELSLITREKYDPLGRTLGEGVYTLNTSNFRVNRNRMSYRTYAAFLWELSQYVR